MPYSCRQLRLVWNIQSLISAHPEEGCPEDHMDDPCVHLAVNKLWTDKLDLGLKILKS